MIKIFRGKMDINLIGSREPILVSKANIEKRKKGRMLKIQGDYCLLCSNMN